MLAVCTGPHRHRDPEEPVRTGGHPLVQTISSGGGTPDLPRWSVHRSGQRHLPVPTGVDVLPDRVPGQSSMSNATMPENVVACVDARTGRELLTTMG